jgi:DNA repair protein RadC
MKKPSATPKPSIAYKNRKFIYSYRLKLVKESSVAYPATILDNTDVAAKLANYYINDRDRETMITMALNTSNQITGINTVSIGSLDTTSANPREVFKFAILANAASIVLAHNHPSGNSNPSAGDIKFTKQIADAGEIIGITLLDHIIIGHDSENFSMKSEELF